MGADESRANPNKASQFRKQQTVRDDRSGMVTYWVDVQTGTPLISRDLVAGEQDSLRGDLASLRVKSQLRHPCIQNLVYYYKVIQQEACGDVYKVSALYEYIRHDLDTEIRSRISSREYFSERELWQLLESIADAGAYLQSNKLVHGDIKPGTILITQKGHFILQDQLFSYEGLSMAEQIVYRRGPFATQLFLAPEILQNLQAGMYQTVPNSYKADVFSLGLTVLEAALLADIHPLYAGSDTRIDKRMLGAMLDDVRAHYSQGLEDILDTMLDFNYDRRPDFITLQQMIPDYRHPERYMELPKSEYVVESQPYIPQPVSYSVPVQVQSVPIQTPVPVPVPVPVQVQTPVPIPVPVQTPVPIPIHTPVPVPVHVQAPMQVQPHPMLLPHQKFAPTPAYTQATTTPSLPLGSPPPYAGQSNPFNPMYNAAPPMLFSNQKGDPIGNFTQSLPYPTQGYSPTNRRAGDYPFLKVLPTPQKPSPSSNRPLLPDDLEDRVNRAITKSEQNIQKFSR
eukprot:TRINITY_DN7135_c0_g1_i9.p1 TRINITY_DN7135_c0_g1~~TRINITY_DN7135_c0_g1_i9.p1  ORF type:complete len:510 (+),score=75.99 TRINITY_DN7135_c0_g1_i9:73-1602(+)